MKKYLVRFTTKDGYNEKEWCYANSESEASDIVIQDHWNIRSIDNVMQIA